MPASNTHYGVLQSTGTQKLLFDVPQFTPGDSKLKSAQTYFADAYKLLNSKGVFPNIANALGLTNAESEVEIVGEGVMKMADRTLDLETLLPPTYEYAFIDEPGVLKIYAQYTGAQTSTSGSAGDRHRFGRGARGSMEGRAVRACASSSISVRSRR